MDMYLVSAIDAVHENGIVLAVNDPICILSADFEDMSCEMFYGQAPPPIAEDPAIQQPCFASMCMCSLSSSPNYC